MAGTNRPNGSTGQIKVTSAASQKVTAPMSTDNSMKGKVTRGGDLRARGSK